MSTELSSGDTSRTAAIKALDSGSVHKISSGQVVVDLQTAVKELVENSLDAGATNLEVRFKEYGLQAFEVIDNGSGIPPEDYDYIALKHHTSKLASFSDLETVGTFGFRGEALSSLCALADSVSVTTATAAEAPAGTVVEFERTGRAKSKRGKAARQRGTTVVVTGLFKPLPVRRKELERNAKREFGKALTLLHAYALVPCAQENKGVRLSVSNSVGGRKSLQLRTDGTASTRASVSALWGPKALENLVELDLCFSVEVEAAVLRRMGRMQVDQSSNEVKVRGLISKFAVGCGRTGTDRQFFFVNGRPCAPSKVQKAFNEVYRSFNATQSPFIIADFMLPTNSCDINVSPDKRTILLHSESNLIQALRNALEERYAPARSTFDVNSSQAPRNTDHVPPSTQPHVSAPICPTQSQAPSQSDPLFLPEEADDGPSPSTVEDEELTFGSPTLLSEPSSSHVVNADVNIVMKDTVDEDGSSESQEPMSPTVTQMVRGASRKSSPPAYADERDDGGDAEMVAHEDAQNEETSSLFGRQKRACSSDDAPIPSMPPPARAVARASIPRGSSVRTSAEQMVLSTSGASWSLRRPADEPLADRPNKKAKLASSSEGRGARGSMRELLKGFARTGSQTTEVQMDVGDEGEIQDVDDDDDDDVQAQDGGEDLTGDLLDIALQESLITDTSDGRSEVDVPDGAENGDVDGTIDHSLDENVSSVREPVDMTTTLDDTEVPGPTQTRSDLGETSISAPSNEIVRTGDRECVSLSLDLSHIRAAWEKLRTRLADAIRDQQAERDHNVKLASSAGIGSAADEEEAAQALSRVIDKADFASMDVVGQFNLGFIIVRRRTPTNATDESAAMDDLFIVDQHAADEKYNFETLQRTTKIDSQKLLHPQILELTAADELVAVENIDVLRQNGFELEVSEEHAPGRRVRLTAQAISKSTVFDVKDLEELLHLMQDRPAGQIVRCSKARAMFAMRACRKSIMIGTPLNRRQMTSVVQHMGTMDQPWHCPHGRPTMRHLSDIVGFGWDRRSGRARGVDWAAFGRAAAASEG
ncbi:hypothetical protein C8Q80DRAFT_1220949 [Daedaleopsis nitida]|nr:hypothetical protein C8Q80DRAFT_1220949 [Daedaleopsis nitida]